MRGTYEYPYLKVMLTKIQSGTDPKTQEAFKRQLYMTGTRDAETHVILPVLGGLKRGEYFLVYQAEFTEENPERKIVVSVYGDRPIEIKRVSTKNYP